MRLLIELSAEHPTLPRAELEALCSLVGAHVAETDLSVALVDTHEGAPDEPGTPADPSRPTDTTARFFLERPGLMHAVSAHWFSTAATPRALIPPFGRIALKGARFAVRGRRIEGAHPEFPLSDTERAVGGILAASGKVDLREPELTIRLLLAQDVHAGALLGEVDRKAIDARHVKFRAHFAPVALHPRYARALVNLARVGPGSRVADPFCGTGGLVLESALVGATTYAGDLDPRMVTGTKATLAQFGIEGVVAEARDVGELPEFVGEPLDAVISDPPYGRASTTNMEDVTSLYDRFFDAAHAALKPGGRLAFITADANLRERATRRFRALEMHDQRVHRSMTRYWGIFQKEGA